ncbi:MAG TPA: serine/threonine-protein kinase [Acidimicrobiales bacterium]
MEISGYTNLEEIGRGGDAVVDRAHQAQFGRQVAIKVLINPGFGETDRARFEREALAMGRLSWHPNIVVVHETGTTEAGMPYLVEEFVEGGSLGDKLRTSGPLDPAAALADVIQLCAAVHTAHEADLLHRDIKPDNALVDAFGRIKLADFGIAAVTGSTLTATGMVTATIAHAAPEVLNGGRATFPSDVYSLGSTLYELLAGMPAFVRDTDESIVPLVLRVTADAVPDLRAQGVPAPVADAVESAMAKDPADRPPTALAFGRELQAAQQVLGLKVTDLAVRAGTVPPPRHDETVMGGVAVVPSAPAAAEPPVAPPPAPAPAVTSEEPVAVEMGAPTGTVAVPVANTPAPGQAGVAPAATPPGAAGIGPTPPTRDKRSRLPLVLAVLVVIGLGAAAYFLLGQGDDGGGSADGGSNAGATAEEHGTEATAAEIPTGARPFRLATTEDGVWATDTRATTVDRIDPATNTVARNIEVGGEPAGIDANSAGVWVSDFDNGTVDRIDPATDQIVASVPVGNGPRNVSATETSVWVANIDDNTVSHIDVASEAAHPPIAVGLGPRGIVATDTDVWVTNVNEGTVMRIDAASDQVVETIPTGGEPGGVVLTSDAVWVTDASQDRVIKIDPATNTVVGEVAVGTDPGGMASTDDIVYVSNSGDDTVFAIDAATSEITDRFDTGRKPGGLAVTDTDLWVANTDADTVSRIPLS